MRSQACNQESKFVNDEAGQVCSSGRLDMSDMARTTCLLHCSITPLLHCSTAPLLHYSTAPLLHYSNAPLLYCSTTPRFIKQKKRTFCTEFTNLQKTQSWCTLSMWKVHLVTIVNVLWNVLKKRLKWVVSGKWCNKLYLLCVIYLRVSLQIFCQTYKILSNLFEFPWFDWIH